VATNVFVEYSTSVLRRSGCKRHKPPNIIAKCHNFEDEDIKNVYLLPSECGEDLSQTQEPSWIQIGISHCQNTTTDLTDILLI